MDYPRALDSSPEDRGLGVRDWETVCNSSLEADSDDDVHIPPEAPVSNSPTPPEESQVLQPSPPTPSPQRLSTRPQRQRNPPNYLEYEQC